ncbi:MAG TPA: hypothetical protein VLH56_18580 [Dissulfurispiraceae bacterium]|nr:hypothetical protein [Dissulfurispiraceae bacterium]
MFEELNEQIVKDTKHGRPSYAEANPELVSKILEAYARDKSVRRVAQELCISHNTVKKYLGLRGVPKPIGRNPDPKPWISRHPTPFAEWVTAQKQPLPRSVAKIAELSGFSKDQIYLYLKRRKAAAIAYLRSLGDLDTLGLTLVDTTGRRVNTGMFAQYELDVDKFSLLVTINATLKFGGHLIFRLTFAKYKALFASPELEMPPKQPRT